MTTVDPKNVRTLAAAALLLVGLAACGGTEPRAEEGALAPVWDRETVLATLDLSELGEITVAPDGTWLLGGKRLPEGLPRDLAHGRDVNLLRVDDATLDAVPRGTRDALLFAGPDAMRAHLEAAGVPLETARAAMADGGVEADEVRALLRSRPANDPIRSLLSAPEATE